MKLNKIFDYIYENHEKLFPFLRNGIIIDTRPLLLFLVGIYDNRKNRNHLNNFNFHKNDFSYLERFIEAFEIKKFYTTPQILTETFYFVRKKLRGEYKEFIEEMNEILINKIDEKYFHKDTLLSQEFFIKFDFPDVSLIVSFEFSDKLAIITDDLTLSDYCNNLKGRRRLIINFTDDLKPYFLTVLR